MRIDIGKVNINKKRFLKLTKNSQIKYSDEKSIIKAGSRLKVRLKGISRQLNRLGNVNDTLDFQVKRSNGITVFVGRKEIVDFNKLAKEKGAQVRIF